MLSGSSLTRRLFRKRSVDRNISKCGKAFSTTAASSSTSSSSSSPIVELREYELFPEHATSYIQATAETVELRKSFTPLRLFCLPETGGQLHMVTHAYYYDGGHEQRNERRAALGANADWKAYIGRIRPHVFRQHSNIFVQASFLQDLPYGNGGGGLGLRHCVKSSGPSSSSSSSSILELRRYQLKLGYDAVPRFLDLYAKGLPSKLEAPGTDPTTSLVTVLYSDVGLLNQVIEVWRHGNGTKAMEASRAAARNAPAWKEAISGIAELATTFQTTIHKPLPFSPIR